MPRAASSCGPTWAEGGSPAPPRRRGLLAAAVACLALHAAGCATPSPRFAAAPRIQEPRSAPQEVEDTARVRREELAEDDRKVDLASIDARMLIPADSLTPLSPVDSVRDRVLLDVVSYLGAPYRRGGTTPAGMDCSGFTSVVFAGALNRSLPRSTVEQFRVGDPVDRTRLQFGDLVFFNTTGRVPSHVGIFIEDDLFAHASVSYGVTFSSLESTYFKRRYVGARRVLQRGISAEGESGP